MGEEESASLQCTRETQCSYEAQCSCEVPAYAREVASVPMCTREGTREITTSKGVRIMGWVKRAVRAIARHTCFEESPGSTAQDGG